MNNKEFEDRVMLSESQYFEIKKTLLVSNPILITNTYYDTLDNKLTNNHKVLRIREINHSDYEMTLKIKCDGYDLEITEPMTADECSHFNDFREIKNERIVEELAKDSINIEELNNVGSIDTRRLEESKDGYLIVLDENFFCNEHDFDLEIEAESKEKAHEVIMSFCEKYNIEYNKNYISKSRRAIIAHKTKK